MSYFAIKTRGASNDYDWRVSSPQAGNTHQQLEALTDDEVSCAVICDSSGYSVYFGRVKSIRTERTRTIRVSAAFCGLENDQARSLVIFALRSPEKFRKLLCDAVRWETGEADREWNVDFSNVSAILDESIQSESVKKGAPFEDAWERFYTSEYAVEDNEKNQLDEELRRSDFSVKKLICELNDLDFTDSLGVKLLISRAPSDDAYKLAVREADRLLSSFHLERELLSLRVKKKASTEPPTPSWPTSSSTSTPFQTSQSTRGNDCSLGGSGLPENSNPRQTPGGRGPLETTSGWRNVGSPKTPWAARKHDLASIVSSKEFLIICGAFMVGVILVVTLKKKHKLTAVKPEPAFPLTAVVVPVKSSQVLPSDSAKKEASPTQGTQLEKVSAPFGEATEPLGVNEPTKEIRSVKEPESVNQ
jgi:hypothetical protein